MESKLNVYLFNYNYSHHQPSHHSLTSHYSHHRVNDDFSCSKYPHNTWNEVESMESPAKGFHRLHPLIGTRYAITPNGAEFTKLLVLLVRNVFHEDRTRQWCVFFPEHRVRNAVDWATIEEGIIARCCLRWVIGAVIVRFGSGKYIFLCFFTINFDCTPRDPFMNCILGARRYDDSVQLTIRSAHDSSGWKRSSPGGGHALLSYCSSHLSPTSTSLWWLDYSLLIDVSSSLIFHWLPHALLRRHRTPVIAKVQGGRAHCLVPREHHDDRGR